MARYVARNLPDFLKGRRVWEAEDIQKSLEDAFMAFDGEIGTPAVMTVLKVVQEPFLFFISNLENIFRNVQSSIYSEM